LKLKSVVFFKILKKKTRKIAFLAGLLGWAPMKKWGNIWDVTTGL